MYPKIALYHDQASGERYEEKAFNKTGVKYTKIGPRDMVASILDEYDVLFLPGAFPLKRHNKGGFFSFLAFLRRMTYTYRNAIRGYLENGGGLIAVCASVGIMGNRIHIPPLIKPYFIGSPPLGIFDFHSKYGPKTGIVDLEPVEYRKNSEARKIVDNVLGDYSEDQFSSLYFRGPAISYDKKLDIMHPSVGDDKPNEVVVARYMDEEPELKDKGAIVYKEFGEGRSISCSVHPEFSTWDLFDSMIDVVARN